MALNPIPIATTGGTHTAQQFRMLVKDLARAQQGVTTGTDLKASALPTPGGGIQIAAGSAVITGRVNPFQGTYAAYNIGSDTVNIAATGGTARSDMVVLRVEDPAYEGNRDPTVDPIVFWEVIPNVSSTATTVPAGYSAVPICRIDIPASTGTITNAYIKDLRTIANPRRDRILTPYYYSGSLVEISGTSETWRTHPNTTLATLAIPSWAATAKIVFGVTNLRLDGGYVFGGFRFMLGTVEATQGVNIDDNQSTGVRRIYTEMVETIDLTTTAGAVMRGTNQPIVARMKTAASNNGKIGVDSSTTFKVDVEFLEGRL
ncbi:hypothetical protein [Streptomyces sp. NRRL F-5135]|uniref:hypothetical protein n=1 Tax=Streptomyces sp. NRRL F-5135 TaxID=1463858 RepID=UPI00068B1F5D|nr:hypothetical protein [Streptomyces sp. NRRL F-5135]